MTSKKEVSKTLRKDYSYFSLADYLTFLRHVIAN